MPSYVKKKTFEATPNINCRYDITNNDRTKIATYNPQTFLIHFTVNGSPSYSLNQLKALNYQECKKLGLSGEEIINIILLIQDLPVIPKKAHQNHAGGVNESVENGYADVHIYTDVEIKGEQKRSSVFNSFNDNTSGNNHYTEPTIENNYDNIKRKNRYYIKFKFLINGNFKVFTIPGEEINLVESLKERDSKMSELRNHISNILSKGWNPNERNYKEYNCY
jgi:hypothetical protein